ncbi:MAG: hypothetical protein NTV07_04395, partial [Candidatus Omnitrophica bacterium]|nr:hypothetical protein [Candidatus Omnitrophota bacterium]
VMMLDPKAPPELIIAAMLHDSDRFFDGYYVMMKDEPPMGSPAYNDFYKPIQHPRMAAEFIVPLLRRLKIDENIVVRVEALIKNHETGITFERRDTAQPLSENDWQDLEHDCNVLRDTDSILVFTPVLLTTILVDLRQRGKSEEFEHEVRIKYGRANPRTRAIIDKLMLGREAEYRATPDGASAYETFLKVRREFAPAAEAAVPASAIVPFKEACYDVAELNRALREALGAAERGEQIGGLAGGIIADIKNTYEDQSPDFVQMQIRRRFEITHRFEQHFGANGGIALARAPGRVNLIGEHIDNQDAKVMPMPIDKDVIIAFRPTDDGSVILHNMRTEYYRGTTPGPSLRPFNANEVPYTTIIEFGATVTKATPDVPRGETFAYIMGSALGIKKLVGGKKVKGCSMLIDGRLEAGGIPQEAGVSSSSALTVASSIALASANNIPIRQDDLGWLAAEWEKYQTAGGAMDQVTSVMGQKGHAIVLDCRTREIKQVPLPAGYKFVAMHTKVKVQQVDSEYNERRTDVEIGTRWLKFLFEKEYPGTGNKIQKIRDITPENLGLSEKQIIEVFNMLPSEITVQQIRNSEYGQTDTKFINDIIGSRKTERPTYRIKEVCLYHRGEIKRVLAAQQALLDGDIAKFARAVNEGQVNNDDGGAENGLQNSCEELDAIIKIALANGAVCGRLSGKGWGGVAVATIPPNVDADGFMDKIIAKYEKITTDLYGAGKGIRLQKGITIFVCRTSNGAGIERYKPTAVPAAAPSPKPKMPGQVIETPKPVEAKPLMRILLVDDEMTARELYKSILQYCEDHIKWTIEVTTAESADDALTKINEARARREPFDIALTDVNMHRPVGCPDGVRPGVWLAQQIKALTKGHMPVFLISGLLDNNALPAGIRDGTIADGAYEKIKGILQNRAKFAKDMEAAVLKSKQATAGLDTLQQADQLALSAV